MRELDVQPDELVLTATRVGRTTGKVRACNHNEHCKGSLVEIAWAGLRAPMVTWVCSSYLDYDPQHQRWHVRKETQ